MHFGLMVGIVFNAGQYTSSFQGVCWGQSSGAPQVWGPRQVLEVKVPAGFDQGSTFRFIWALPHAELRASCNWHSTCSPAVVTMLQYKGMSVIWGFMSTFELYWPYEPSLAPMGCPAFGLVGNLVVWCPKRMSCGS